MNISRKHVPMKTDIFVEKFDNKSNHKLDNMFYT